MNERGIGAPLSAIHFQAGHIRQASCNTLPRGCQPPWPPPCCPNAPSPFNCVRGSGALAARPVLPASPVLLTRNGPLGADIHDNVHRKKHCHRRFKVCQRAEACAPRPATIALHDGTRYACYPVGNFGGNQLPDGSIGLSPPYPGPAIDLHVRTASGLHRRFPRLRPPQA